MFEEVLPGDVVLVLWTDIGEATEQFQRVVHQLQAGVGGYNKTSKHRSDLNLREEISVIYLDCGV